ncbi:MAG: TIGR01906 family membrane protein [Eubacteriaceae bacterium]|nr:TIGR01906 family membrane protein [Eubacteriaceae bacterium]
MKTIVKIIIILLLSVVILSDCALFGLLMTTDDDLFYEKQFKRQDIAEETGLDFDILMQVNDEVQDYLNAKRADLVVYAERYGENTLIFNENEQSHMKDVRDLYSAFKWFGGGCVLFTLCVFYFIVRKKDRSLAGAVMSACGGAFTLPVLFVAFFDKAFVIFHHLFFEGDTWLFDPDTNIIVNIYTWEFFIEFVTRVGVYAVAMGLIIFLSAAYFRREYRPEKEAGKK